MILKYIYPFILSLLVFNGSTLFSASINVTGTIQYEKVVYTRPTTNLDETTTLAKLSGAIVTAYEGSSVLASTTTNTEGSYSLDINYTANYSIRVESRSSSIQVGSVVSSTGTVSSIYSDIIIADRTDSGSGTYDHTITVANKSGAFNIFQQFERGRLYFQERGYALNTIKCVWPGVSTFYEPDGNYMSLLGVTAGNSDPDEFDDDVILHEFGHYAIEQMSKDQSIGGQHSIFGQTDMRLAWSEGVATWVSCAIRDDSVYIDSVGSKVNNKTATTNYDNASPGSQSVYTTNELAVTYVLWQAYKKDGGSEKVLEALTKFKSLPASIASDPISMDTFHDMYTSQDLSEDYLNRKMSYYTDSVSTATQTSPNIIANVNDFTLSDLTFYPNNDIDYFEFSAQAGSSYTFQTNDATNGALTALKLYAKSNPSQFLTTNQKTGLSTDDTSGFTLNAIADETYVVEVSRFMSSSASYGPYGSGYGSTVGRYGGYSVSMNASSLPSSGSYKTSSIADGKATVTASDPTQTVFVSGTTGTSTGTVGSSSGGGGGGCFLKF